MSITQELLNDVNDDPDLLKRVITGDETWVNDYDVETKAQSSQWKQPEEPRSKKARQVRSNVKSLFTVFFDYNGAVHREFLPQDRIVNKEFIIILKLCAVCVKQYEKNARNCGTISHGYCTTIMRQLTRHCSRFFGQKQHRNHASATAFIAPCDFFLFPKDP